MPPKKQPPSLKVLSSKLLTFTLIYALLDEENFDTIRDYFIMAPYNVLETLQKEIVSLLNFDASIRFNSLAVLLREDVKHLETGMFPRFYYDRILVTIMEKGLRLQELNLRGVWARDFPYLLSEVINNLTELKCLEIPHMADDLVIKAISNLKKLAVLDISGEGGYTQEGIKCLKNESLKILDIGCYGKVDLCFNSESNYELVADIIENLPSLSILKTYSFTGHALQVLNKRNPGFRTKLTYIYDSHTTNDIFEAIVVTCPNLNHAHFSKPYEAVVEGFSRFKKMNSLKLTQGNKDEFVKFLQQSDDKMEVLQLNHNKIDKLDLADLCRYAAHLKDVECFQMSLKFANRDNLLFRHLNKLQLLYCDISDKDVMALMVNCPQAKVISIGSQLNMTDEDVFTLFSEHTFHVLEELIFSFAPNLTALSVELLCSACANLKVLGTLTEWCITEDEFLTIKMLLQSTNTDLTLLPVF